MNGRKKVTVIGAGNVGATCALEVARRDYADVVLVDIVPNFAAGKALDMNQMASVTGYEPTIVGTQGYDETKGSDATAWVDGDRNGATTGTPARTLSVTRQKSSNRSTTQKLFSCRSAHSPSWRQAFKESTSESFTEPSTGRPFSSSGTEPTGSRPTAKTRE